MTGLAEIRRQMTEVSRGVLQYALPCLQRIKYKGQRTEGSKHCHPGNSQSEISGIHDRWISA